MFVVRAVWSFSGETDEDLTVEENQRLYVLDADTDPEWWLCATDISIDGPSGSQGRVPSNYVEPAPEEGTVVALYEYEPQAENELSLTEDQILLLFRSDAEDWWLVSTEDRSLFGWVPANYVERRGEVNLDHDHVSSPKTERVSPVQSARVSPVIIQSPPSDDWHRSPTSPVMLGNQQFLQHVNVSALQQQQQQRPQSATSASDSLAESQHEGDLTYYAVTANLKGGKKQRARNGLFAISNTELLFVNEKDKSIIQQWFLSDVTGQSKDKKRVYVEFGATTYDFLFQNKAHAGSVFQAITSGKKSASAKPPAVAVPAKLESSPKVASVKAPSIKSPVYRKVYALYEYAAQQQDEISVYENEEILLIDDSDPDWFLVRASSGAEGFVPANYVGDEPLLPEEASHDEPYHYPSSSPKIASPIETQQEIPILPVRTSASSPVAQMSPTSPLTPRDTYSPATQNFEPNFVPLPPRSTEQALPVSLPPRPVDSRPVLSKPAEPAVPSLPPRTSEPPPIQNTNVVPPSVPKTAESVVPLPPRNPDPVPLPPRPPVSDSMPLKSDPIIPPRPVIPTRSITDEKSSSSDTPHLSKNEQVVSPNSIASNSDAELRTWTDKSGSFQVEARYLGKTGDKVILHKTNGVKIAVPISKLSDGDIEFIKKQGGSIKSEEKKEEKKAKSFAFNGFDWFGFFIGCGMNVEDSERYASKFVDEKMDGSSLEHLSRNVLKDLGVAEGDVLRILAKTKVMTTTVSAVSPSPVASQPPVSVTNAAPSPILDPKVAKIEKQAEKKIMEMLANTSISKGKSNDVISSAIQMQQDEALAKELQAKELKAAGLPPSALYSTLSAGSTAGGRRRNSKPASSSAVDSKILFDLAKKVETTSSSSTSNTAPSWMSDDFFNRKPESKTATNNSSPVFGALSSKPATSAVLQDPLVPLTSSVMPLPVTVSTGDGAEKNPAMNSFTNTRKPSVVDATMNNHQMPVVAQNITPTSVVPQSQVRPVPASAVTSTPQRPMAPAQQAPVISATSISSTPVTVQRTPQASMNNMVPQTGFDMQSASFRPHNNLSQQGSMMNTQAMVPDNSMNLQSRPVPVTQQIPVPQSNPPNSFSQSMMSQPATHSMPMTPTMMPNMMQPLRPQMTSNIPSSDPYAVFKEADPRAPSIFDQPHNITSSGFPAMPPMPTMPMMPGFQPMPTMPGMPMFQDPFNMQQPSHQANMFAGGGFPQQQPQSMMQQQQQQPHNSSAYMNNPSTSNQGRWF